MRRVVLAFVAVVALLGAHAAVAAPTCQDRNGDTIKCATPGAMPVGWTLPLAERLENERLRPPKYPSTNELLKLLWVMGMFFALLALLPEFEGDWDKQEGDDKRRRY